MTPPTFVRHRSEISAELAARLADMAAEHRLNLATALNAAFAETIARHSVNQRFLLNLPVFLPAVRPAVGEVPLGNYTSNILVPASASEGTFASRAAQLARDVVDALAHIAYSGARVARDLARLHGNSLDPGAPVVLTNLLEHRRNTGPEALPGGQSFGLSRTPQVLLDHQVVPMPDGSVSFHWDAVEGAFADGFVAALSDAHRALLHQLANGEVWRDAAPKADAVPLGATPTLPAGTGPAATVQTLLGAPEWLAVRSTAEHRGADLATCLAIAAAYTVARWSDTPQFFLAVCLPRSETPQPWRLLGADRRVPTIAEWISRWQASEGCRGYTGQEAGFVLRRDRGPASGFGTAMPIATGIAVAEPGALADADWVELSCSVEYDDTLGVVTTWHDRDGRCADGVLAGLAEGHLGALRRLADDEAWDQPMDVVPAAQLQRRLTANATTRVIEPALLHQPFVARARATPDAIAVTTPTRRTTYAELDERTDRLAAVLRRHGAAPGELVAILVQDNDRQVEAAIAVSKAGAAYVPIDPGWPELRRLDVLRRSGATCAVVQSTSGMRPPDGIICVDADASGYDAPSIHDCGGAQPSDLAYVIFTSGSTGAPKGVAIEHAAAHNTVADLIERFDVRPSDRVFAISSFAFDLSVFDIFGALAAGGTVVLPERSANPDPAHWHAVMANEQVTLWNSVPALMDVLIAHLEHSSAPPGVPLRQCWLSGDWIPLTLPDRIRRVFDTVDVVSLGGATEASIWSIYHRIDAIEREVRSIPYGRPLANQRWHVLDEDGRPQPDHVPGELHIAGTGLARGYWADPERTAASFTVHPGLGERLYRTGDRGRYRDDGTIEFLGRRDTQVKIRGNRIELGEIEAVLERHGAVRQCAAAVRRSASGSERLVAWATVSKSDSEPISSDGLVDYLRARLPGYMVPIVQIVEELPLTANGKIDRDKLPDPAPPASPAAVTAASSASLVAELCELIADTLQCEPPAPDADLIDLGVSSVDVVAVVGQIEARYGMRPSYQDFFREPTVAALARLVHARSTARDVPVPMSMEVALPTIIDPAEREAFKRANLGIRGIAEGRQSIPLARTVNGQDPAADAAARRATRRFAARPVTLASIGAWLAHLASCQPVGDRKHAFGSAGGLYPVQTYVHFKPGAVADCAAGIYYHHPRQHSLIPLAIGAEIGAHVHDPFINQPVYASATFSVFFVDAPQACEPVYGSLAERFCMLEAGAMGHILEVAAPHYGLRTCPIGWLDFEAIAGSFDLQPGQRLLHSLVGGPADTECAAEPASASEWEEGEL